MTSHETAIVFGVGSGLGWALARRFAKENMQVAVVAREKAKLNSLIQADVGHDIRPYAADVCPLPNDRFGKKKKEDQG